MLASPDSMSASFFAAVPVRPCPPRNSYAQPATAADLSVHKLPGLIRLTINLVNRSAWGAMGREY
jgi:hypothetical protein